MTFPGPSLSPRTVPILFPKVAVQAGHVRAGEGWCWSGSSLGVEWTHIRCFSVVLTPLFALQGPACQLHVNPRDTLAQLEIAKLKHFPQSTE